MFEPEQSYETPDKRERKWVKPRITEEVKKPLETEYKYVGDPPWVMTQDQRKLFELKDKAKYHTSRKLQGEIAFMESEMHLMKKK